MARKRINKKFALTLAAILGGVVIIGGGAVYVLTGKDSPAKLEAMSQAALDAGDLDGAYTAFSRSVAIEATPEKLVRLGDIARTAAAARPDRDEFNTRARSAYERALELDPRNAPALNRSIAFQQDMLRTRGGTTPQNFARLRELAERLVAADPNDAKAKFIIPVSHITEWMSPGFTGDPAVAKKAVEDLEKLVAEDPSDAAAVNVLVRAQVKLAMEIAGDPLRDQAARNADSAPFIKRAVTILDDALAKREQDLAMHVLAAQLYEALAPMVPDETAAIQAKMLAAVEKGRSLATPDNPAFADVNHIAATFELRNRGRDAADAVYRQALEQLPGSQALRIRYAEFLAQSNDTRAKAIELLSKEIDPNQGDTSYLAGQNLANLKAMTERNLESYRLDEAMVLTERGDTAAREAVLKSAEAGIKRLAQVAPDDFRVLTLEGRYFGLMGQNVAAVQKFERARTAIERVIAQQPVPSEQLRTDRLQLMVRLSDAYRAAGQSGKQRDLLRELADESPRYIPTRVQLIGLLFREGDREAAKAEFDRTSAVLAEMKKENRPELQQVLPLYQQNVDTVATLFAAPGTPEADPTTLIRNMPEAERGQRIRKAQFAIQNRMFSEATRVLQVDVAADPKDVLAAGMLVEALALDGKNEQAQQVLQQAIAANPEDTRLKLLEVRITGGSAADQQKLIEAELAKTPDEFTREMQLYLFKNQQGRRKEALEHLARAEALKPDERGVLDQRFQNAIIDKDFATAERVLPKLIALSSSPEGDRGDQAGGRLYRFRLLAARGSTQEALSLATELTQQLPSFALSWTTLGQAYAMNNEHERALQNYEQALLIKPDERQALLLAIESAMALNRPADARKYIETGLTRLPGDAAFIQMGRNFDMRFGDPEQTVKSMEESLARIETAERDLVLKINSMSPSPEQEKLRADLTQLRPAVTQMLAQLGDTYVRLVVDREAKNNTTGAREAAAKSLALLVRAADRSPEDFGIMASLARVAPMNPNPGAVEPALKRTADSPALASNPEPMRVLAQYYLLLGRGDDAEKAIREAVRRGGSAVGPRYAASIVLMRLGKVDDALAVLNDAEGAATNRDIQRQRVEILVTARRFDQAEKALRSQLEAAPNDTELNSLLALTLLNAGRFDDALKQVETVLSRDPQNASALYYRAQINLLRPGGDVAAAIRDLREVRNLGSFSPEQRLALVDAYFRTNEADNAILELRELVEQQPANRALRMRLAEALNRTTPPRRDEARRVIDAGLARPEGANDPELLIALSQIQMSQRDVAGAVESARAAVEASKSNPGAVRFYLDTLLAAQRGAQVLRETQDLVNGGLKVWWVYAARGAAKAQMKDNAGALAEFSQALQVATEATDDEATTRVPQMMAETLGAENAIKGLAPQLDENIIYRLMTAQLQAAVGRLPEGLATLEPVLLKLDSLRPVEQSRVLRAAAGILVSPGPQQNFDRGADLYRRLVKLTPNDIATLNNLSFVVGEKITSPNPVEALSYSERAVDLVRRSGQVEPLVYDTHGWNLVLNNRVAEGINFLTQALERRSFLEAHYHLGMAYLKFNLPREALAQFERAEKALEAPGADQSYRSRITEGMNQAAAALEKSGGAGGGEPGR